MEPRATDPNVGGVLDGKYQIERLVGSGAMGTVYRARHLELGVTRAVKLMKPELANDPSFVERFEREARVLERLRNPHLVALHDFCRLPSGACYIVSEYVDGETLAERLQRPESWTATGICHLFSQIADGLGAAHRVGVIHRDVSPDNVMMVATATGARAKVLDFGLAKDTLRGSPGLTGGGLLLGKIGYAAPEQMGLLAGHEKVDARSDVFSLAAVLYRVVCGRLPWRSDSLQSYLHDLIVRPESELHSRIDADAPPSWRALFRSALARERDSRPASMADFTKALTDAASGVTPPAVVGLRSRALNGRRWVLTAASVVALTVFAVFWNGRQPKAPPLAPAPRGSTALERVPAAGGTPLGTTSPAPHPLATNATTLQPLPPENAPRLPQSEQKLPAQEAVPAASASSHSTAGELLPAEGRLVLACVPEATVSLDGEVRGHTPLSLDVAVGNHRLRLTSADGQSLEEAFDVVAGAVLERSHRFPGFGSVAIVSDPWMEVSLDGGPAEQTPVILPRVSAGRHVVTGQRAGYEPITMEVDVQMGETRKVGLAPQRAGASATP